MRLILISILIVLVSATLTIGQEMPVAKVMFTAFDDYTYHYFLMDENGENLTFIMDSFSGEYRVSPDYSYLLYLNFQDDSSTIDGNYDIFVTTLADDTEFRLTETRNNLSPIWSPDGTQVAFISGEDNNFDVYLVTFDPTADTVLIPKVTRLTTLETWISNLDWSSNEEQIAFIACKGTSLTDCDLYTVNVYTRALQNLTTNIELNADSPKWSPTTRQIAFITYDDNFANEKLQILNLQSMNVTSIAQSTSIGSFEWSPDGDQIAYSSTENEGWDLYVAEADGSNKENLTNNESDIVEAPGYGLDWSIDGSQIVYSAGAFEGYFQILVMNSDGSNSHRITKIDYHLAHPQWVYGLN